MPLAPPGLFVFGGEAAAAHLAPLLESGSDRTVEYSGRWLLTIREEASVAKDQLAAACLATRHSPSTHAILVRALATVAGSHALPTFQAMIEDEAKYSLGVRAHAALAASGAGGDLAPIVPGLLELLNQSKEQEQSYKTMLALAAAGPAADEASAELMTRVREEVVQEGEYVRTPYHWRRRKVQNANTSIWPVAMYALGEFGAAEHVPELLAMLQDDQVALAARREIVQGLGAMGPAAAGAVARLRELTELDPSTVYEAQLRDAAIIALARIHTPHREQVIPILFRRLREALGEQVEAAAADGGLNGEYGAGGAYGQAETYPSYASPSFDRTYGAGAGAYGAAGFGEYGSEQPIAAGKDASPPVTPAQLRHGRIRTLVECLAWLGANGDRSVTNYRVPRDREYLRRRSYRPRTADGVPIMYGATEEERQLDSVVNEIARESPARAFADGGRGAWTEEGVRRAMAAACEIALESEDPVVRRMALDSLAKVIRFSNAARSDWARYLAHENAEVRLHAAGSLIRSGRDTPADWQALDDALAEVDDPPEWIESLLQMKKRL